MKKLIITGVIASLLIPATAFGTFSDVNSSTDYSNAIHWMADNGVIDGYPDGSFQPDRCVNRVEMLKMLFLANETELYSQEGTAGSHYYDDFFSDTDTDEWYWPYLDTALRNGVVEGYPDGTFKPSQCVNRVEAVKMSVLEFNNSQIPTVPSGKEALNKPYDVDSSAWYYNYIMKAINEDTVGLTHATYHGGGTYNYYPGDSMTRKEVAEMLYRMKAVRDNGAEKYSTSIMPSAIITQVAPWIDADETKVEIVQKINNYCEEHNIPECSPETSYYVIDSNDKYQVVRVSGFNYLLTKRNNEWTVSIATQTEGIEDICETGSDNPDLIEYCSN